MAEKEEPEVEEFMEIGGSPVPGITLRHILHGHTNNIHRIAWSPDGHYLASPSEDKTVRIWDVENGNCIQALSSISEMPVHCVTWSPDGNLLASSEGQQARSANPIIRIWDASTWQIIKSIEFENLNGKTVHGLAWSPTGEKLALGFTSNKVVILDTSSWQTLTECNGHKDIVNQVAWSHDELKLASSSGLWGEHSTDKTVRVWNPKTGIRGSSVRWSYKWYLYHCMGA